jgi:hypothetical protein
LESKQASLQQDAVQVHKHIHRKHLARGFERRGEPSNTLLPTTADISTDQPAMGGNHVGDLSPML